MIQPNEFDLVDIEIISSLRRHRSFTSLASHLCLTTSALSRRIARLEKILGARLIERTTHMTGLTPFGAFCASNLEPVSELLNRKLKEIGSYNEDQRTKISVACIPTIARTVLPESLSVFRQHYPNVRVVVRESGSEAVRSSVSNHDVEFGITNIRENPTDLICELIANDPYYLICSLTHSLAQRESVQWSELSQHRLVGFSSESIGRKYIDDALRPHGFSLLWEDEYDSIGMLIECIKMGTEVAIIPFLGLGDQAHACIPLVNPVLSRRLSLIRRHGDCLSSPAELLWGIVASITARISAEEMHRQMQRRLKLLER